MTTNQKEMFGSLLLDKKIVTALTDMGFEEPCFRYSAGSEHYRS